MPYRWFLLALLIAHAAAQTSPPANTRDSADIEGQVVNQRTSAPLAAAQVKLQGSNGQINQTATDRKGRFSFAGVEPGEYRMLVERTGFVTPPPNKMMLNLSGGETLKDLTVRLTPQAIVSGTVLDADAVPVAQVFVALLRRSWQLGKMGLMHVNGMQTNDAGEFRITALRAGDYLLCVQAGALALPPGDDPGDAKVKRIYIPTWYPGVSDAGSAAPLHLAAGEERTGLAITLRASTVVKVSGHVALPKTETGMAMLMLMPADETGAIDSFHPALAKGPDGAFTFPAVPPGSYRLQAHFVELRAGQQKPFEETAVTSQIIQVGDTDVEGITVAQPSMQSLSGVIHWEGKPPRELGDCMITLDNGRQGDLVVAGKADGTFTVARIAPEHINLDVNCDANGSYVKAARLGDTDILEKGIEGGETLPPGPLLITMATGAGEILGTVNDSEEHSFSGATVVAVPEASKRPGLFRTAPTDQHGRFKLTGVVPGAYSLYAWDDPEGQAWLNYEFVKKYEGRGQHVSLDASGSAALTLHVLKVD